MHVTHFVLPLTYTNKQTKTTTMKNFTIIIITNSNLQTTFQKCGEMTISDAAIEIEKFLTSCSNRNDQTVSITFQY